MGRNKQGKKSLDARLSATPYNKLKKDPGVPKLIVLKRKERNHEPGHTKGGDVTMGPPPPPSATIGSLALSSRSMSEGILESGDPGSSRGQRDSTVAAHAHQFRKVLDLSDVVIQVLDARDPLGCRSRIVEDEVRKAGGGKMMILALNKTDLVPKENVIAWLRYLRHDYPTVPLKSSSSQMHHSRPIASSSSKNKGGAPHLLTLLKSYRRAHTSLTVGIVGPPNVGKSSLINSLSRLRGGGGDVVRVGTKPGETRDIKEVGIEKGLKVLDMPGIVWGDFLGDGSSVENGVSRVGSLNMMGVEFLEDPVGAVESIVSRVPAETLQQIYSVPPFSNATEFLVMVALSRGRLGKGGVPDQVTAARSILNDWNAGSIPYHTVPPAIHPSSIPSVPRAEAGLGLDNPTSNVDINDDSKTLTTAADVGSAQIVSKFSEPFDLDGLFSLTDKAVLDNDGEDEIVDDAHMEGIDADEGVNRDVEDADAVQDETALEEPTPFQTNRPLKRAHSPTASIVSLTTVATSATPQHEFEQRTTRPVKLPKPKRARYNPNAPLVFDSQEIEAMAGSNPFNRKRLREEAKRRKKAPEDMVVDDQDGPTISKVNDGFIFKPSVSAFAVLAAEDVPLPDEDEDEEL